jgi:hypothetical protein
MALFWKRTDRNQLRRQANSRRLMVRIGELMREPPPQRLEQTLDFVDARAYLHQVPRRRGAVVVGLLLPGSRHAVCELV